jgi:hypothetical protein
MGASEAGVRRPFEQTVKGPQGTAAAVLLGIHLLQAEHIGSELEELRPQRRNPFLELGTGRLSAAQALQVECGDPQRSGNTIHSMRPFIAGDR